MKNTRKILVALLLVFTLLMSVTAIVASAEQPEKLYLTPNANWKQDNARFAAYFFGNGEIWVSMTDADKDGIYEVIVPTDKVYPNVIFCRMNPGAAANNWNNKWNQTADLTIPTGGPNHYTVKEGTWDSGGGTWSTYGSSCLHTNLGPEATCTDPQICLDCKDPVVSALGHNFDAAHLCQRCGEQASFTVAGSGAHLGTEWDTGNTANDMTYADGVYTKVYTNVAAGSYAFKVVRDHDWGTAYPSADKSYTVATTGSTVTITLKGTTVDVKVEAPHVHSYFYPCDPVCQECYEISNPDAKHTVVHVEAVAATCYENGNIEYWYCSDCGTAWTDEAQTQLTNMMSVVVPMAHAEAKHVEAKNATCTENGNIEYWLCEACGQAWLDAACTQNTNVLAVVLPAAHSFADGKCSVCGEADPDYVAPTPVKPVINISDLEITTTVDGELIAGTGISASAGLAIDSNSKSVDGFEFTKRLKLGGTMKVDDGVVKAGIKIVTNGPAKIIVYAISSSSSATDRTLQIATLADGAFAQIAVSDALADTKLPAKVEFVVDEAGTYYVGSTNSGINLYYIAVEDYVAPEIPEDYTNSLVVGDNDVKIGHKAFDNGFGYLTEAVVFTADEKAHYKFTGEGLTVLIYDATMTNNLCGFTGEADLEAGMYIICFAANTTGTTGDFKINVAKSEITPPDPDVHVNSLVVGDNKFVVTDKEIAAYAEYILFSVAEDGKFTFTVEENSNIVIFVYTDSIESLEWALANPYVTNNGTGSNSVVANLKAGTYMVVVNYYYGGVVAGEYNINVAAGEYEEGGNDVVVKNTVVLGENTYVLTESLKTLGYEFTTFNAEKAGWYTFAGQDPLTFFIWPDYADVGIGEIPETAPYRWNVKADNSGFEDIVVYLEAGVYAVGFRFDFAETLGEYTYTISYSETDPNAEPDTPDEPIETPDEPVETPDEQPEEKLNFFQKIWKAILDFFKKLFGIKD